MANGIRTGDPPGFNKGRSSKFREGSRVQQTPEDGRRTYRLKRYRNNDGDDSPITLNDKNHQASSQKFTQLISESNCLIYKLTSQGIDHFIVCQFTKYKLFLHGCKCWGIVTWPEVRFKALITYFEWFQSNAGRQLTQNTC